MRDHCKKNTKNGKHYSKKSRKWKYKDYIKKLYTKKLKSCHADIKNLDVKNLKASQATVDNLSTTNLNVTNINGETYCPGENSTVSGVITPIIYIGGEAQKPFNTGFNQEIFDALWDLTQLTEVLLNFDSDAGRYRNNILSDFYECERCPPYDTSSCPDPSVGNSRIVGKIEGDVLHVNDLISGEIEIGQRLYWKESPFLSYTITSQISDTEYNVVNKSNDYSINIPEQEMLTLSDTIVETCINVPMTIYGVENVSMRVEGNCPTNLTAISYNINIANKTLQRRVAAVYVNIGYINPNTNEVEIQSVEIDTRQFDSSILSFGEQMNNTILLPSRLVNLAAEKEGVIQLSLFVEDGLEVFLPDNNNNNGRVSRQTTNLNSKDGNYSANYASVTQTFDLFIDSEEALAKHFTPVVNEGVTYYKYSDLLNEDGSVKYYFVINGGGGGGAPQGGGGGGGQGYKLGNNSQLTGPSASDPLISNFVYFRIILGEGGTFDVNNGNGGSTEMIFYDSNFNRTFDFTAKGGDGAPVAPVDDTGSSNPELFKGGNGYNGGGGGSALSSFDNPPVIGVPGKGGEGDIQNGGNDGKDAECNQKGCSGGDGGGDGGGKAKNVNVQISFAPNMFLQQGSGGGGGEIINGVNTGGNGDGNDGVWGGGGGGSPPDKQKFSIGGKGYVGFNLCNC